MTAVRALLTTAYQRLSAWAKWCYRYPLAMGVLLSLISGLYLIADYGVINRSALSMLWQLQQPTPVASTPFAALILTISQVFHIGVVTAAHALMVVSYALITALLLLIAKRLYFAKISRWALIFLLLAHPSFNDFRAYVIVEPLFWCCWLLAVYVLLVYYRKATVLAIVAWLALFLLATQLTVAAWFWLLLFPFGALVWRPWRSKSVSYALLGYAAIVGVLLFLPVYHGETPIQWFRDTVVNNPSSLSEVLGLNQSNWVKEENTLMAGVFVFSGALSLLLIRTAISFGVVSLGLAIYAVVRRQYQIIDAERLRILQYIIAFDLSISVVLFVLDNDSGSVISFSVCLLLLLLSALGLSYVFKKMHTGRYSRLSVLVIVWCLVAYLASGFIIFGPRKDYLQAAGQYSRQLTDLPLYSNDQFFLFYADKNPDKTSHWEQLQAVSHIQSFYFAYEKNRNRALPKTLQALKPIKTFANRRGDKVLIYRFER